MKSSQSPAIETHRHEALRRALAGLADVGVVPACVTALAASAPDAADGLRGAVLSEVAAFSTSGNPELRPALEAHVVEHIDEIVRLLGGGRVGEFEFVAAQARRRAEQHFPIEAMLHTYRCGHRVLGQWLRSAVVATGPSNVEAAVSAVADFALEYTNTISTRIASEYVAHARLLAESEGDRRTELLGLLLDGFDESDARATRVLKRAGYLEQRQSYCVIVAQSVNPVEMEWPERAQRIVNAVTAAIAGTSIRCLAQARNNVVVAVLSDVRRQSGWTAPRVDLAERLRPLLLGLGPAVLVGMSTDQPSTSFIPRACNEAMLALDFASVSRRLVGFSDLPLRNLVLHHSADFVRSVAPGWVADLREADRRTKGALVATLRTLADADLNVQKAGRRLGVHPNTVYARIARIRDLTGLDGQRHHDLVELLLAADSWHG